ncbi:MAG: metallophosphoesterase family protein [Myxococcales bacterium]
MSRPLAVALVLLSPALAAAAGMYPYVSKGPVILGVTPSEAWVSWYTVHHQGTSKFGNTCYNDALTGSPNDTIPTVTLKLPNGSGATFEDPTCSRFHRVHLVNLQPDTAYSFTLDMEYASGGAKASGSFKTAPAAHRPFKFVVYGDNRDAESTATSTRALHESVVAAIRASDADADFLLNTGDMALNLPVVSGDDRGYTEFFEIERPLLATHPSVFAFSNHESIDPEFYDGLASAALFAGAPHPRYFSFDWGKVHVAVLDAFEGAHSTFSGNDPMVTDAQAQWLDGDLAAAKARGQKLFLMSHHGAFSHGTGDAHGGNADMQKKIVPLMLKYGVLSTFAGHDHYFEHGREQCTDYLVVGAGGAPLYAPDFTAAGLIYAFAEPSFVVVSVDAAGNAKGVAKDGQGNVIHAWDFVPAGCETAADAGMPAEDAGTVVVGEDAAAQGSDDAATEVADGSQVALDAAAQPGPDAQAAQPGLDAASVVTPGKDAGSGAVAPKGCGCSSAGSSTGLVGLVLASVLARRWRRRS